MLVDANAAAAAAGCSYKIYHIQKTFLRDNRFLARAKNILKVEVLSILSDRQTKSVG